jgi:hypothetical protein
MTLQVRVIAREGSPACTTLRIEVPFDIRLDRPHLTSNSHLYEVRAGRVGFGVADPDWRDGPRDAPQSAPQ